MNALAIGSCEAIANFSWLIGAFAGSVIDIAVIAAIAHTPPLREHGGTAPPPIGRRGRTLPWLTGVLVAVIWLIGLGYAGRELLFCYAFYSAAAAGVAIALLMAVLFPLAASQIARRSIW